jgi:hypothetical protein
LIHDAAGDNAMYLEGCIAPFLFGSSAHYKGSALAMKQLWELLGGYEMNKRNVTLQILNNFPGEKRTKEQWIADRIALARKKALQH